jgi:hypothetical protein
MARRTSPPRPPAGPPANAEEGAAHVRAALVKLFDRGDGTGADWKLMLESLYRAGFKIADDQLTDEARQKIMRRVHEGAEVRLTGGFADGSGPSKTATGEGVSGPASAAGFKSPTPRPRH